jgi:hypothetical protein
MCGDVRETPVSGDVKSQNDIVTETHLADDLILSQNYGETALLGVTLSKSSQQILGLPINECRLLS